MHGAVAGVDREADATLPEVTGIAPERLCLPGNGCGTHPRSDSAAVPRKIVVIPTYNERQSIPALVAEVLVQDPEIEILIVDDNSPDGTGALVRDIRAREPRLHLLARPGRQGLGPAYKDGFRWALDHAADLVVQMDADFSHNPAMLPRFFAEIVGCDLVLGSRYVQGITVVNWPIERLLLSYFGNAYVRRVLGMSIRDATGGFKCWRRSALETIDLEDVRSNGYAFQIEMTYRAWTRGLRIREIPIIFMDRTLGESKMTKRISLEALWIVWWLRLRRNGRHARSVASDRA
jgi:dolichol-phosphate mannosyltransferase